MMIMILLLFCFTKFWWTLLKNTQVIPREPGKKWTVGSIISLSFILSPFRLLQLNFYVKIIFLVPQESIHSLTLHLFSDIRWWYWTVLDTIMIIRYLIWFDIYRIIFMCLFFMDWGKNLYECINLYFSILPTTKKISREE